MLREPLASANSLPVAKQEPPPAEPRLHILHGGPQLLLRPVVCSLGGAEATLVYAIVDAVVQLREGQQCTKVEWQSALRVQNSLLSVCMCKVHGRALLVLCQS